MKRLILAMVLLASFVVQANEKVCYRTLISFAKDDEMGLLDQSTRTKAPGVFCWFVFPDGQLAMFSFIRDGQNKPFASWQLNRAVLSDSEKEEGTRAQWQGFSINYNEEGRTGQAQTLSVVATPGGDGAYYVMFRLGQLDRGGNWTAAVFFDANDKRLPIDVPPAPAEKSASPAKRTIASAKTKL